MFFQNGPAALVCKILYPLTHWSFLSDAGLSCLFCCFASRRRDSNKTTVDIDSPRPTSIVHPTSNRQQSSTDTPSPLVHAQASQKSTDNNTSALALVILTTMAATVFSPLPPGLLANNRRVSGLMDSDVLSNNGVARSVTSRRVSYRKSKTVETSEVSSLVHSLKRRSGDELGAGASSKLMNHTHDSVMDWIRSQRMSLLPPEGSSYDKVLSWAQLFIERLHDFDEAIEEFAGDSYLAARLAYGYCALLLEVQSCILLK